MLLRHFHPTQSLRLTVTWRGVRIRRVKLEYAQPHLLRRIFAAARR